MKVAKSMRYGGELIDAVDCDYDDFRSLIPLCPNCNEPVFLRKESDRVSKLGKKFKVTKHWVHFDSTSEEQKASCEERVGNYTEADRQKIQRQARGQRLKLIQRWFWKAFVNGFPFWDADADKLLATFDPQKSGITKELSYLASWYSAFSKTPGFLKSVKDQVQKSFTPNQSFAINNEEEEALITKITGPLERIDRQLHVRICQEIALFLAGKKQEDVLFFLIIMCIDNVVLDFEEAGIDPMSVNQDRFASRLFSLVLIYIGMTPWASEFEKLEASASLKKKSMCA